MKIYGKYLLFAAAIAATATSCSDSADDEQITSQILTGYINVVTDIDTGDKQTFKDVSYTVDYNYSKLTANIAMSGFKLPGGATYPTMKANDLKWTAEQSAWKVITANNPKFTSTNFGGVPLITDFTFGLLDRWYDDRSYACSTVIRFIVDNRYSVMSVPSTNIVWGKTTVKHSGSHIEDFVTEKSLYVVEIDPDTHLAAVTVNNFALSEDLSRSAVSITDIPYTLSDTGKITLKADKAEAKIAGQSDSSVKMPVSNLSFVIDNGEASASYVIVSDGETYQVSLNGK